MEDVETRGSGSVMQPIFVVGAPRSGTTLLAAMLGSHSRIACGPETDFFHFLRQADIGAITAPDTWPEEGARFLFEMVQAGNKAAVPFNYGLTREDITSYLVERKASVHALLEAVTGQDAERRGKARWVEKTPRHLLHLETIRAYYPDAPIIRIVRDPRDAALSITRAPWPWAPRTFFPALRLWEYCEERSRGLIDTDSNACTVRYEDLLESPARELAGLCDFVGEVYEPAMIDTKEASVFANGAREPWKAKVAEPLDRSRIAVWKRELGDADRRLADLVVGKHLRRYGYETEASAAPGRYGRVWPEHVLDKYPNLGPWLESQRIRLWPASGKERPDASILLGDPEEDAWLGHGAGSRAARLARIIFGAAFDRLRGVSVHWIVASPPPATGVARRLLRSLRAFVQLEVLSPASSGERVWWRKSLERNPRLGQFSTANNDLKPQQRKMTG